MFHVDITRTATGTRTMYTYVQQDRGSFEYCTDMANIAFHSRLGTNHAAAMNGLVYLIIQ